MEALNLKRPAQGYGKFKYFKTNKHVYEKKNFQGTEETQKAEKKIIKPLNICFTSIDPNFYPFYQKSFENFVRNVNEINTTLLEVTQISECKENLRINEQYQELESKVIEVIKNKEEISRFINEETEKERARVNMNQQKLEEIQEKIKKLKEEKNKIEENNAEVRKVLKFFRDFSGIEILDVLENPLTLHLKLKHEGNFIQFKLVEEIEFYEYNLISASIDLGSLPNAFQGEISFEKDQFQLFYEELIEFIINYE